MRSIAIATLLGLALIGQPTGATTTPPAGFTLLYSADERGEIEPCG